MPDENGKKEQQAEFEVNLFEDYSGNRVYSDKRFPNGRIRLYLPSPEVNFPEAVVEACQKMYNRTPQQLFDMGVRQHAYGERDWDILKKQNEANTDEAILTNIEGELGSMENLEAFVAKAREFFEGAMYIEARERKTSVEKTAVTKLKSAGVNLAELDDEMIKKIVAAQQKKQAKAEK